MEATLKSTLRMLAHPNRRGVPSDHLLYDLQFSRDLAELAVTDKEQFFALTGWDANEDIESYLYYLVERGEGIVAELARRKQLTYAGVTHTNQESISAIKNAIAIEDVLAWYTDVFLNKQVWSYRCTIHGADEHPSGVIYPREQRFWCYVCNKGGDVFDAVQTFERIDLPGAIKKLARFIGLDIRPEKKRMGIAID